MTMEIVSRETESPNLRAQFAERINAAWHKGREVILDIANTLIEAKRRLAHGSFQDMVERDLPFGPDTARMYMRIGCDPRVQNHGLTHVLPTSPTVLERVLRLKDNDFHQVLSRLTPDISLGEAKKLIKEIKGPHAPGHLSIPEPCPPAGADLTSNPDALAARIYPERVWLYKRRRAFLGYSQLEFDQVIGWPDGMTSHLETPHDPENGKVASHTTEAEWLQGLRCGLRLVPDEQR